MSQQRRLGKILRMQPVLTKIIKVIDYFIIGQIPYEPLSMIWRQVQGSGALSWIRHHQEPGVILCLGVLIHLMKKEGRMK